MKLYIKNMVCIRCIMAVRAELEKLRVNNIQVELGKAECKENLTHSQLEMLNMGLIQCGLELIEDKRLKIIKDVKSAINELIHSSEDNQKINLSEYISKKMNCNYPNVSKLFSKSEGISIEKYYIRERVEVVKELHIHIGLTLTEISYRLKYSSVSHLSNQFKVVTGLNASSFKDISTNRKLIPSKV
ncbi:MAG: AraC family transcriptional regulator [Bacteroidales bacterium]|nr:AraC family transcriptional regulator [Bacteroidales bacterium]